jgi:prepilin-type N-terminal cleavage/methylation domain-containing protein
MKVHPSGHRGFTLVEIMIVVAIVGLLAAIAIPNFVKARSTAQKNSCIANLKQLEGAVQSWALENKKTSGDPVTTADAASFLKGSAFPGCPAGGSYSLSQVGVSPACSRSGEGHTL